MLVIEEPRHIIGIRSGVDCRIGCELAGLLDLSCLAPNYRAVSNVGAREHTQFMTFQMNPDFPRAIAEHVNKLKAVLESVSTAQSGQPVDAVKVALLAAWTGVGNGASISDPDLTTVAGLISTGKRVWLEDNGKIMADD